MRIYKPDINSHEFGGIRSEAEILTSKEKRCKFQVTYLSSLLTMLKLGGFFYVV